MSNSSLVSYRRLSPNYSSRDGAKIDRIAIHHMAGNLSLETCGRIFADGSREASATYGVDSNGRIGQYVDEAYAPWTTCSYSQCDRFAVTIEVANDIIGGDWHVSDKAIEATIKLCVDVCKRNGIKKLTFTGDKKGTLLMHKYFWATACPGPYLASKFPYICAEINKRLSESPTPKPQLEVDGLFGYASTKALQEWLNVPFVPDGEIGGQLKEQKKYFPNIVSCSWSGTGSTTVELLQQYLKGKGFNPGSIDGYLGKDTITAWQKFLVKQGYNTDGVDGVFGPASAKAMQMYLNKVL